MTRPRNRPTKTTVDEKIQARIDAGIAAGVEAGVARLWAEAQEKRKLDHRRRPKPRAYVRIDPSPGEVSLRPYAYDPRETPEDLRPEKSPVPSGTMGSPDDVFVYGVNTLDESEVRLPGWAPTEIKPDVPTINDFFAAAPLLAAVKAAEGRIGVRKARVEDFKSKIALIQSEIERLEAGFPEEESQLAESDRLLKEHLSKHSPAWTERLLAGRPSMDAAAFVARSQATMGGLCPRRLRVQEDQPARSPQAFQVLRRWRQFRKSS